MDNLVLVAAVIALAFLALFAGNLRKMLAAPVPQPSKAPEVDQRLMARKVYNEQMTPIGESLRATATHLIVKKGGSFALVPRTHLQEFGADIIVDDGVDWKEADAMGEQWRKDHEDKLNFDKDGNMVLEKK